MYAHSPIPIVRTRKLPIPILRTRKLQIAIVRTRTLPILIVRTRESSIPTLKEICSKLNLLTVTDTYKPQCWLFLNETTVVV